MKMLTCEVCDGDGFCRLENGTIYPQEDCKCCKGETTVDPALVDDGYLYQFRKMHDIGTALAARGCIGWVVDAVGATMPGTEGDVANGCHLLARDEKATAILHSKEPTPKRTNVEFEELERLANLVRHAETLENAAHEAYRAALRNYGISLTDLAYLEAKYRDAERETYWALKAHFARVTAECGVKT